MIKTSELTPRVYNTMSRDFQLIGRLYDAVLNAVKTDTDLIYSLPVGDNVDISLITLLSTTLGFIPKHKYNSKQLSAICNVLTHIIRHKGSISAITIAVNALLNAEGIVDYLDYRLVDNELTLFIPEQLSDLTLLNDLMDYITPAGLSYNLVKELKFTANIETTIATEDTFEVIKNLNPDGDWVNWHQNYRLSQLVTNDEINSDGVTEAFKDIELGAKIGRSTNTTMLNFGTDGTSAQELINKILNEL